MRLGGCGFRVWKQTTDWVRLGFPSFRDSEERNHRRRAGVLEETKEGARERFKKVK